MVALTALLTACGQSPVKPGDTQAVKPGEPSVAAPAKPSRRGGGYYKDDGPDDMPPDNLHAVPDDYIRKQTIAGAERFVTPALKSHEEKVLGADERISVAEALAAVTIGGAYQLKMDHEVGSIRPGLRADFAVLDEDPFEVDPMALRDIGVWGTVLSGVPQPADGRS